MDRMGSGANSHLFALYVSIPVNLREKKHDLSGLRSCFFLKIPLAARLAVACRRNQDDLPEFQKLIRESRAFKGRANLMTITEDRQSMLEMLYKAFESVT